MDMNALETAIAHGIRRGMYGEPGTAASAIVPLLKLGAIVLGLVLLSKARSSSGVWISDPHHGGDGSFAVGSAPPGPQPPWREVSETEIQQGLQDGALKRV